MNPDTTHAEPVDVTINRLERELCEKTNEVARLREQNEKLRTLASHAIEALYATADPRDPDPIKFRVELTRLAPAPEEPVTGICLICHEKQTTCSSGLCDKCKVPEEPMTHPLMDCKVCGEFRGHGHQCKEPVSKDISHAFKDGVKATLTGENNEVAKWFKEPAWLTNPGGV